MTRRLFLALALLACALAVRADSGAEKPVPRTYVTHPPAPAKQTQADAEAKSKGCVSCHTASDRHTMHANPGVVLGCTDCHGGNAKVGKPAGAEYGKDASYLAALETAHVLPRFPKTWKWPSSASGP